MKEQINSKLSQIKEIIIIRAVINEIAKQYRKSVKPKVGFLRKTN